MRVCNACEKNVSFTLDDDLLSDIYEVWMSSKNNTNNLSSTNIDPCSVCIGLLDTLSIHETFNQIDLQLSLDKHVYDYFCVALKLPKCLTIRKKFDETIRKTTSLSVKEALRSIIEYMISKKYQKQYDKDALFVIELNYSYDNDKLEVDNFMHLSNRLIFDSLFNRKRKNAKIASNKDISDASENLNNKEIMDKYLKWLENETVGSNPPKLLLTKCYSLSIFIGGRYNKYSRNVAQTPWFIEKDENDPMSVESYPTTSVQEIIVNGLQNNFKFTDVKFTSSGREDVDVRMLGRGRPFIMELIDPIITHLDNEKMSQIQKNINESSDLIRISFLQIFKDKKVMDQLYHVAENIAKNYLAVIIFKEMISNETIDMINETKDLVINQKTPLRVLHRRVACNRQRTIYSMKMEPTHNPFVFVLSLRTQSGTYIKEFVHGDMCRTSPSIQTLTGIQCDIISLDVKDVDLNWPPEIINNIK